MCRIKMNQPIKCLHRSLKPVHSLGDVGNWDHSIRNRGGRKICSAKDENGIYNSNPYTLPMRRVEKDGMIMDDKSAGSIASTSGRGREDGENRIQVSQAVMVEYGAKDHDCLLRLRVGKCGC